MTGVRLFGKTRRTRSMSAEERGRDRREWFEVDPDPCSAPGCSEPRADPMTMCRECIRERASVLLDVIDAPEDHA